MHSGSTSGEKDLIQRVRETPPGASGISTCQIQMATSCRLLARYSEQRYDGRHFGALENSMIEFESVRMKFPEDTNIIVGQTHFIKTAEDMYEAVVNTVPQAKFGLAFNEASGPCLIRILRQERTPIQSHGEVLNLIGVDYQQARFSRDHDGHLVDRYLEGSEKLVMPDMVNILLSHNPNSFDRAAELCIDLTLAGHSHGGQLALSFINRGLALVYPETPYVSGWYEKPGGQLYVNRGIGTTGPPIRLGTRPEITVLELVRGV